MTHFDTSPHPEIPLGERCVLVHKRDEDRPRRALDGLYVCAGHRKGILFDLLDLPGLYERLPERHNARSGAPAERSSSGHAGLDLRDDPADCRSGIYFSLSSWTKDMIERRALSGWPPDEVRPIATFMLGERAANLDWWCAHPAVDDFFKEIDPLHSWAFRLNYPTGQRRFEIPGSACIAVPVTWTTDRQEGDDEIHLVGGCGRRMFATLTDVSDMLPSRIWCDECGIEISADRWITYGRRVHKAMGVSA